MMAEGRGRAEWAQTSAILAMLANTHRDPKKSALHPKDFNPYGGESAGNRIPITAGNLSALKHVFVQKGRGK